jgi:hypothetical protein
MKKATTLFLVPFLALAVSACSGGGGGDGGSVACTGTNLTASAANNYSFSSTLTFPPIAVAPKTELTFDWAGVTKDFLGHSVTQSDIDTISILMWNMTLSALQTGLNADTLLQNDLTVVPLTIKTDGTTPNVSVGATSAKLYDFTLNGGAVTATTIAYYFDADTFPPSNHTYTMMAATGTTPGQGVQMIQSFQLDKNSTNDKVTMTSASTTLTYNANLHNLKPTGIPAGQAAITLDWSGMTTTALGGIFDPTSITYALVGHYTETPTQLESKFLDIQLIATEMYSATISIGTSVDFSTLTTSSGKAFSGIDTTGTWLVALQCGACRNPAPWYLTILKPCS